ncbi:MAG: glycoside hydrolase family 78 protein [Chloroflexi bacterium]|nr:glycoside hydrolase family 78 protein [Chloroflexota bacterium]MCC6891639.1 glycoside hydrolase family 78 protein [Anaerolineae bacterium]
MTVITNLVCEYRQNPLGIDVTNPRLGWQMQSSNQGARQTAYQVVAASTSENLHGGQADLWDSGRIESDQSLHVVYGGKALQSRQRVYWQVTVWDETGAAVQSETAWFEIGLLDNGEWAGQWIGAELRGGPRSLIPAPLLRKAITLSSAPQSARLYVTALGLYECSINGQAVSDDVFNPGWTDYSKRVQYKVYDVTKLLKLGDNVLGAALGDGWAVGHISWNHRQQYVDRPRLLAQLEVTLDDGSKLSVVTDESWRYQFGPILSNDLLMGEEYDARLEMPGWDTPSFDDRGWRSVETFEAPPIEIVATNGPTVKRIEELKPVADPVDKGNFTASRVIFDLGQNMVGWVRFKGSAPANTTITLRYAEVLNDDGTMYTTNLRSARAVDYYTFKDANEVEWEPTFTFHGFRYVEIQDYPGKVTRDTITGIVLHSEMAQTGDFQCSDPTINQLQKNIVWGQRGNFVDIPTDCPQRDERLGWTGDIQVFVRTAAYNMDVAGFMTKWAQDVTDSQSAEGIVPPVVPKMRTSFVEDGGPAWSDAAVICPWTIYLCYGDKRILETSYSTMTKFVDFLLASSPGYIRCAPEYEGWPGFGDWLSINAATPRDLIGTAFLAYDAALMTKIAAVLGKTADEAKYRQLFEDVKAAFGARYLKGSTARASERPSDARRRMDEADAISRGNLKEVDYGAVQSAVFNTDLFTPTQTSYVLALYFDLLPEERRAAAVEELVADIQRRNMHLSTGFVGAPYLPHVLSNNGRLDMAYELVNQKTWPSWLYSVTQGATTIWERWDGWTEENGFQSPAMNSFNHYAYGSIGAWLYNTTAGIEIDPAQPAYKHSILRPQPGGGLTNANGTINTPYGTLSSQWELNDGKLDWQVNVPPNTTATLHIPISNGQPVSVNGTVVNDAVQEVSAGQYHIVVG